MCPDKQHGFGLPMALFIITVMAFIALALHRLSEDNARVTGTNMLSQRAFYAAESGMNIAMNRLFPPAGAASACSAGLISALSFTSPGLAQCQVNVSCVMNGSNYRIRSVGQCGQGSEQTTRIVEVVAR